MSYVSFLCARLLDLRNETRAARVIQGAWRKYRLKKDVEVYKVCSRLVFYKSTSYTRFTPNSLRFFLNQLINEKTQFPKCDKA